MEWCNGISQTVEVGASVHARSRFDVSGPRYVNDTASEPRGPEAEIPAGTCDTQRFFALHRMLRGVDFAFSQ